MGIFDDFMRNMIWQNADTSGEALSLSGVKAVKEDQKPVRPLNACNIAFM